MNGNVRAHLDRINRPRAPATQRGIEHRGHPSRGEMRPTSRSRSKTSKSSCCQEPPLRERFARRRIELVRQWIRLSHPAPRVVTHALLELAPAAVFARDLRSGIMLFFQFLLDVIDRVLGRPDPAS